MLDLAPHNPYGLEIATPFVARAGLRGAGVDKLVAMPQVGAVIGDPLLRRAQAQSGFVPIPAGLLYPNGGRSIHHAQRDLERWNHAPKPIIPTIQPHTSNDIRELLDALDPESTPALVLDLTAWHEPTITNMVQQVRAVWERPILVECACDQPIAAWLAPNADTIDAVLVARGCHATMQWNGTLHTGRMIGATIQPTLLHALAQVDTLAVPFLIGASTVDHGIIALQRGATALVCDVGLWVNPNTFQIISDGINSCQTTSSNSY